MENCVQIFNGDCLVVMQGMADNSIDAIVTDPPYGLSFMGRKWDYDVPTVEIWREAFRVLKPGGHLLSFGGSRTYHRLVVAIEDAGFEVRDQIMWLYGSGFPKSLDVSKAIDKAAGVEREVIGNYGRSFRPHSENTTEGWDRPSHDIHGNITAPATDAARQWQGWGTALKPAHEPICVARKPLIGTVAENVQAYGTGVINIDECRVGDEVLPAMTAGQAKIGTFERGLMITPERVGRWPANVIHDGSDEVLAGFPVAAPTGSAARFFYCAKATKGDREEGLDAFTPGKTNDGRKVDADNAYQRGASLRRNTHPTVKPTDLMRYLCRLVTPPGGVVLDPFMGSGSTGKAAVKEGFRFIGIERDADYVEIARARVG